MAHLRRRVVKDLQRAFGGGAAAATASQPADARAADTTAGSVADGGRTATLFDFGNPAISAQVPVNYVVDGSGRFAQVTFLERAAHDDIRTSIGSGTVYRLNPDGSANNGRWGIKLKK